MHWRDFLIEGDWQGLQLTIPDGELAPRPPLRVEAAPASMMRVVDADGPLLWAQRHDGREGLWWLAADRERTPVVPPITAAALRAMPETPPSREYWSTWARWFARRLMASPLTPLRAGVWALACGECGSRPRLWRWQALPAAFPAPHASGMTARALAEPPLGWSSWIGGGGAVLRLGRPPAEDRVRAWRKRARDGTLPPVLLMLCRGMGAWLILDGHARLAAALAESGKATVLHLFLARTDREGALSPSSFAWPLPGGTARWREEAAARLAALGRTPDHALMGGLPPYQANRLGRPSQ